MRKLFKKRKLFKGGNYMRKFGIYLNAYQNKEIVSAKQVSGPPGFNTSTWSLFDGTKNLFLTNVRNTFSAQ